MVAARKCAEAATPSPRFFFLTPEDVGLNVRGVVQHTARDAELLLTCTPREFVPHDVPGIVYDLYDAKAGLWPDGSREFSGVGAGLLEELQPYLSDSLLMIDRHNWTGASLMAQHRLLWKYAEIWDSLLRELKPQVVLFHDSPHWAFANVLYALCRSRAIETGMVLSTSVEARLVIRRSIESQETVAVGATSLVTEADLEPSHYVREVIPTQRDTRPLRKNLRVRRRLHPVHLVRRLIRQDSTIRERFPGSVPDRYAGTAERLLFNIKLTRRIRTNIRSYERGALTQPPMEYPYVYCPLHLQPEATTVPDAGRLWEQLNNVRLLSSVLPVGWRIVVKEHPQMTRYFRGWPRARGEVFYEELASIWGVERAALDLSSKALLLGSRLVATATGTVGWEAVNAGRYAIVFGFPWYLGVPGVLVGRDREQLSAAFAKATATDFVLDPAAPMEWLRQKIATGAMFLGSWRDVSPPSSYSTEELVEGYGVALRRFLALAPVDSDPLSEERPRGTT